MANFTLSFIKMLNLEGGYTLHKVKGDTGGLTYAGISYKNHPKWKGWAILKNDESDLRLAGLVKSFYKKEFWDKIKGDSIKSDIVAQQIFTFVVNSGIKPGVRLAQHIINATPDGIFGPITLAKLNEFIEDEKDEKIFVLMYALSKIVRYKNICMHDKRRKSDKISSNMKFICGWINRVEKGLK